MTPRRPGMTRQGVRNLDGLGINRRRVARPAYCGHNWTHSRAKCHGCEFWLYDDDTTRVRCTEQCLLCGEVRVRP